MRFDPETHTLYAAGRSWPADPSRTAITNLIHGRFAHRDRRCMVRFESGWSASIIWGSATYSSNHDAMYADEPFTEEPALVEVGVIDHTGELRMRQMAEGDDEWHDLEAYLDDEALAALLDRLATLPTDFDYGARPPTMDEMRDAYDQVAHALGDPKLPPWKSL